MLMCMARNRPAKKGARANTKASLHKMSPWPLSSLFIYYINTRTHTHFCSSFIQYYITIIIIILCCVGFSGSIRLFSRPCAIIDLPQRKERERVRANKARWT